MGEKKPIDVEDLVVWTYSKQRADVVCAQSAGFLQPGWYPPDSCVMMAKHALVGVGVASQDISCQIHPDAEAVHNAVLALYPDQAGLLIKHGRSASRPDWMPGARASMQPVLNWKGKPVMEYDGSNHPIACRVRVGVWAESIHHHRMLYGVWRDALAALWKALSAGERALVSHLVLPPSAAHSPWERKNA